MHSSTTVILWQREHYRMSYSLFPKEVLTSSLRNKKIIVCCTSQRRTKVYSSNIQSLACRSVTGPNVGLDVYQHIGYRIHLCWNSISDRGYYLNCIVRWCWNFDEIKEFTTQIGRRGLDGLCEGVNGDMEWYEPPLKVIQMGPDWGREGGAFNLYGMKGLGKSLCIELLIPWINKWRIYNPYSDSIFFGT
jgi:hypothetical protein